MEKNGVPEAIAEQESQKEMLAELNREFTERISKLGPFTPEQGKQQYSAEAKEGARLFAERFGGKREEQRRLMKAILSTDDRGFAHLALEECVNILATEGQRDVLVELLAKRCPERLYLHLGIEDLIVIVCQSKLKDGAVILFDAYDKAESKEAKHALGKALMRAFKFTGVVENSGDDLGSRCRTWYETNQRAYGPNTAYLGHLGRSNFPYDKQGVLVKMSARER